MKKTFIFLLFVLVAFNFSAVVTDTNTAFAVAPGGDDGGCCDDGGSTGGGGGGGDDTPNPPVCDLSADAEFVAAGDQYTISWANGTAGASYVLGGQAVQTAGFITYTWDVENVFLRFTLTGSNAGGSCTDTVTVYKKVSVPTCDISTNLSVAKDGDEFTVSWMGTPEASTVFRVNGQVVVANDSQTYNWPVGRTEPVTVEMTGNNAAGSCSDSVTITNTPVETPGCTDPAADNYNPAATTDDGSCTYTTPAPTCDAFTAAPMTITKGDSTTLTWESTNAVQVFINNAIGAVAVDGTMSVAPLADTTYVLTLIGAEDKTVDCSAPVVVNPVVVVGTPAISIIKRDAVEKDDTQEVSVGGTAQFEIVVTNTGDEDLVNVVVTDPIEPACNKTIGALAKGASDTYTCNTTNVQSAFTNTANVTGDSAVDGETVTDTDPTHVTVVTVGNKTPICNAFTATPRVLPVEGGTVVLDWELFNTATAVIDNGIGDVTVGNGTIDGTMTGARTVAVTQSTTFTLTATDVDGEQVSCIAPVAVADPGPLFTCETNVSFSASDTSISRGQSSTLNWSTTDVDSLTISGINSTDLSGSESVSPSSDTTYTLEATQGTQTISCPVKISVSTGGGGGGSSSPRCELEISEEKISLGEEITITWDTRNATEVTLTDDEGEVLFTTDDFTSSDKRDYYDYSIDVTPTKNTTYTLLAERGSKDEECDVEVEMDDDIVLLQVRDQAPLVSGISLTQVPYTGFEAGPVMTVLFYMLLVTWALYITYVLVIPKTRLAVVPVTVNEPKTNVELMSDAEQIRPDVFAAVASAPVAEAPTNLPTANAFSAMPVVTEIPDTNTVENQAHALQALVSSDAARTIAGMVQGGNQAEVVAKIVADAKGAFPLEDGWVVINQSRLAQIVDTTEVKVSPSPTGAGSLAEAIVTGNVVAAYELVGARPMIALADAATDLDALYRTRKGAAAEVSDMLTSETANLADEQIAEMIAALTGALDGTYSDEGSAVKMAIMKAVNIAG